MAGVGIRYQRGMAIITALFFGLMCMFMATGFLAQVPVDLGATTLLERHTKASYVADAAIVDTMAYISYELSEGREPCTGSTYLNSGSLGDWTWECLVEPDSDTPPNWLTSLRIYRLTATAFLDGAECYRIVADVQGGQSFARFNMFVDRDLPDTYDFVVGSLTRVRGPVHKNHPIRFFVDLGVYSAANPPDPIPFDSRVSTTAPQNYWYAMYDLQPGGDPADYDKHNFIFANGKADLEFSVPERPLPSDSTPLALAAWGSPVPGTLSTGVHVNPMGGVYVQGDVDNLELAATAQGCILRFSLDSGATTVEVLENQEAEQRHVTVNGGATQIVPGAGTGVVYIKGDLRGLHGTNKGSRTIANDFETEGRFVELAGPLLRADTLEGDEPQVTSDAIGVVTRTLYVANDSKLPRSLANPLRVYATLLATDRLEVRHWNSGPAGAMQIYGGLISGETWRTGRVNLDTLVAFHGYGGLSGHGTPDIVYDKLLPNEPPPEYPTTAATELQIRSWTEQRL